MNADPRKAAIAAYKERKSVAGIYAVHCVATGEVWVGHTPDLDKAQNRIWFMLRHGGHLNRALHAAWQAHGSDAFTFEQIEKLDEEESSYIRHALLKERAAHWRSRLSAVAI